MKSFRKLVRRQTEPAIAITEISEKGQQPVMTRRKSEALVTGDKLNENNPKSMPNYYFQGLSREGAEGLLKSEPGGTFLVRDRQHSLLSGCYTLTLRDKDGLFRHYRIETNPANKKLVLQAHQEYQFESLESLIDFFVSKQTNADLKPYIPGGSKKSDGVYEDMNENNDLEYMEIGNAPAAAGVPETPPKSPSQAYQNIPGKASQSQADWTTGPKGGHWQSPPLIPIKETKRRYENLPGKNKTVTPQYQHEAENQARKDIPLQPRHQQPPLAKNRRQLSLPQSCERILSHPGGPPPLPARPYGDRSYQNLPAKGALRPPLRRAQTAPEERY